MKRTLRMILAVLLILVITLCAILLVQKIVGRARVDLTQHRLYTLSEGTRNILAKLNQPVRLKLYYSWTAALRGPEEIRYFNNYYFYVRDLLEEYVALADGLLTLSVIDPRGFSEEEDEAIAYGVQQFPLSEDESFFFGLVAQTELGKSEVIPFFEPGRQEFVEYDVSRLISNVTRRQKKKIGVLSSLPVMGSDFSPYMMQMLQMQGRTPEPPWNIITHLRQEYEITSVPSDAESIEEDVDFLMVIHPKDLPDKTLFAIDQYVMRGGKLIMFVDPHCMSDRPPRDPRNPYAAMDHVTSSDLNALLRGWGVQMEPGAIAADRALAITASVRKGARPTPLVTYLGLNENCVNQNEIITAKLHSLQVLFAGVLTEVADADTTITPLLYTTKSGNTWHPASPFELQMLDPQAISRAVTDGTEPLMLACRISGKLKTNFPDGPPQQEEGEEKKEEGEEKDSTGSDEDAEGKPAENQKTAEQDEEPAEAPQVLKEADPEAAVLVFADVDMISDMVAYQETFFGPAQVGDNASLLFNSIEFLAGGSDLIAIRSRGRFSRPFHVVDEIEIKAEKATASEVEALDRKIREFEEKLRQLGTPQTEKDAKLLQSKAVAERKRIQEEIRKARKEMRKLNAGKREQIEALKAWLQFHNLFWAPAVVLLIAVSLAVVRYLKARHYAARRT